MSLATLVALSGIIFGGFFIQGVTGFGATLFVMPLAILFIDRCQMLPICLIYTLVQSFIIVYKNYKMINIKQLIIALLLALIIGMPLGEYAVIALDANILKIMFAMFIFMYSIKSLYDISVGNTNKEQRTTIRFANYLLPVISGCLQTAFGVGGPALMAFLSKIISDKNETRATICAYWIVLNSTILTCSYLNSTLELSYDTVILLLPAFVTGGISGGIIANKISQIKFLLIVYSSLILSALLILVQVI